MNERAKRRDLPAWAAEIQPLDMFGAATVLGISRRTLVDVLKIHKHYELRGSKKVFYPENIAAMREAMNRPRERRSSSAFSARSIELSGSAFEKALALATEDKQKNKARKRGASRV